MSKQQVGGTINDDAEKLKLLNKTELDEVDRAFSLNSLRVLESRYLLKDGQGKVIESPKQLFERIATLVGLADVMHDTSVFSKEAKEEYRDRLFNEEQAAEDLHNIERELACIAGADFAIGRFKLNQYHIEALTRLYISYSKTGQMKILYADLLRSIANGDFDLYEQDIQQYYNLMISKDFLPNTPTLMNAGARLGQLSACFVLGINDNIESIMQTAKDTAFIFKSGGGVGINYSDLRPEGSIVASTSGVASGPVSFMGIIDKITDVIKQGGKRRGANMGILEISHPDIKKFITAKRTPGVLENFNVSVGMDGSFWKAINNDDAYEMKDGTKVDPEEMMDLIANSAWASAEPGLIFLDNLNRNNPLIEARGEPLRATNPCVTGDTLLATENGWIPIKDAVNTNTRVFYQHGLKPTTPKAIMLTRDSEDVYELRLKNGMTLRCTKDHPILTAEGMKDLYTIKVGDKIKLASFPVFGRLGNYDEGLVAGWLVADGNISGGAASLDFYGEKREIVRMFADKINAMVPNGSGLRQQYIMSPQVIEGRNETRLKSTRLLTILSSRFNITAESKTSLNHIMLQTTQEFQKGFLQSMFSADGSVNISQKGRQASIRLGSVSTDLLKMAQLMLSNFNIHSSIYLRKKASRKAMPDGRGGSKEYNCKNYYELLVSNNSIDTFMNRIGFLLQSKNKKIDGFRATMTRGFYNEKEYAVVEAITYCGREPVYDVIETPNHQIAVNGIITSQCGEQSLYPFESCNLGSINLANFVSKGNFDWIRFRDVINLATQFLDDVIDMNKYPLPQIEQASKETRRIGLGVMGLSDALIKLGIKYNSKEGFEFMNDLAETLTYESMSKSVRLAMERGSFGLFNESGYISKIIPVDGANQLTYITSYNWKALAGLIIKQGIRNSFCTTVAPTGSLSMIADCSSGIEPTFALSFEKRVAVGKFFYKNKYLKEALAEIGLDKEEVWKQIAANKGSIQSIAEIPQSLKDAFVTTFDLTWEDHVRAQAAWQMWISNAISKTINLPHDATVEDVKNAYILAHDLGLKGITVYRDGSRHEQVLHA